MTTFTVIFHRYSAADGSRFSDRQSFKAESFFDAHEKAALMLSVMRATDLSRRYIIAEISTDGLRGDECNGSLWETMDEFTARVRETSQ